MSVLSEWRFSMHINIHYKAFFFYHQKVVCIANYYDIRHYFIVNASISRWFPRDTQRSSSEFCFIIDIVSSPSFRGFIHAALNSYYGIRRWFDPQWVRNYQLVYRFAIFYMQCWFKGGDFPVVLVLAWTLNTRQTYESLTMRTVQAISGKFTSLQLLHKQEILYVIMHCAVERCTCEFTDELDQTRSDQSS